MMMYITSEDTEGMPPCSLDELREANEDMPDEWYAELTALRVGERVEIGGAVGTWVMRVV